MDLSTLTSLIPAQITFGTMVKFIAVAAVAIMVLSLVFRLLFGKKSALNNALCAGIGVLCIYILTIVIYTFSPGNLERFLVPLPFVKFSGDYLHLMNLSGAEFSVICSEILSMVILVLLYNLMDSMLPFGDSTSAVSWFLLRYFTIAAAMLIHYFFARLTHSFLPELLISYGPTILLVCLIGSLLMGILSLILGLVLTFVNPIFGLMFTFFFSNKFGKQISKAMLTTLILVMLLTVLNRLGYGIISISASALLSYIPMLGTLMLLWYVIGRKL